MSFLVTLLGRSRPATHCLREQCTTLFHTSAVLEKGPTRSKKRSSGRNTPPNKQRRQTSRTRLVKDLRPKGRDATLGSLKVAPRDTRFATRKEPPSSRVERTWKSGRDPQGTMDTRLSDRRPPRGNVNAIRAGRRASVAESPVKSEGYDSSRRKEGGASSSFNRDALPHAAIREVSKIKSIQASRAVGGERGRQWSRGAGQSERLQRPGDAARRHIALRLNRPDQTKVQATLDQEFDRSGRSASTGSLPSTFSSPPLMEGLLKSVNDVLGENAKPSPIQGLVLKHLFHGPSSNATVGAFSLSTSPDALTWKQYLLASETGSGKSIAYLLPMLQYLKQTELERKNDPAARKAPPSHLMSPRALILAPTHELSRQLSTFAKRLLHNVRLRVMCSSQANVGSAPRGGRGGTAAKMREDVTALLHGEDGESAGSEFEIKPQGGSRPVDVLVGTPMKALEMVRGWGWDKVEERNSVEHSWDRDEQMRKFKGRKFYAGPPEMALSEVEYVVIDEADVLFDNDFRDRLRLLLADISNARGHPVPETSDTSPQALNYPFHLILTSATIPSSLGKYLDAYHPQLTRLASPNLHRLPSTLRTEHVPWTGGNRNADIEKRIRRVWAEDALRGPDAHGRRQRSKVLVFCNRGTKVEDLAAHLTAHGIANVALTSTSGARQHGSNHHLDGFLRATEHANVPSTVLASSARAIVEVEERREEPHVLITTSLLSRGLDFAPSIRHVFIVDAPRNMIDFLHRAGRSGRAGEAGKVVVFGKMKGRGSTVSKDVRRKVGALAY